MKKILDEEIVKSGLSEVATKWGTVKADSNIPISLMQPIKKHDCSHIAHIAYDKHDAHFSTNDID